jgi:hypothetical protein
MGHAAAHERATGHQHPQHLIATLAVVAEASVAMLGSRQQLCRVCA